MQTPQITANHSEPSDTLCTFQQFREIYCQEIIRDAEATWRSQNWERRCPRSYRETDPAKLPRPDLLVKVMGWTYGPRGLLLYGPTGLGKSRCAWKLVEREYFSGRRFEIIDHGVAFEFMALFKDSPADAAAWIKEVSHAPLLLMDDCFKSKLSEALEAALFVIIASRDDHGLPIIATVNDTGKTLRNRMSNDRGDAMVRRLRENCQQVAFV